ncbi:hypothetical protein DY000_02047188 [Brassica cretica]|uniref:Uncharacterized protein n=1 Tax=Brassica cretica TaxID=69181 RepID=A0ABQ7F0Z8_BRACR|nr:hypothetical protein DY000_02047188 [Brassica cretica]
MVGDVSERKGRGQEFSPEKRGALRRWIWVLGNPSPWEKKEAPSVQIEGAWETGSIIDPKTTITGAT